MRPRRASGITLLYTDREPVELTVAVGARRVRCLRTNEEKDFGRYTALFGEQYAIMLESDVPDRSAIRQGGAP